MKPMIKKAHPYNGYFPSIFDEFFGEFNQSNADRTVPAVNVRENDKRFVVEIASPGMNKNDFNLEIEDDRLVISGEVQKETLDHDEKFTRKEFSFQSFKRSFALPEGVVNKEAIEAKYENGLLRVTLPKQEEEASKASRRIEIA